MDSEPGPDCPSALGAFAQYKTHYACLADWRMAKHPAGAVAPKDATPVPLPDDMPPPRLRAARLLVFAHQLLDAARPAEFRSWELCSSSGVGAPTASALRITASDGSVGYLRGTAASGGGAEPETDPYP